MKIKRFFAPDMRQAIRMVRDEQGPDAVILSTRNTGGGVEIVAAVDYDADLVNGVFGEARAATVAEEPLSQAESPEEPESPVRAALSRGPRIEWSQDPALAAMQEELKSLRAILQDQVSRLATADYDRREPVRAGITRRLVKAGFDEAVARGVAAATTQMATAEEAWREAQFGLARRVPVASTDLLEQANVIALVGATGVGKTTTAAKLAARASLRHGSNSVALISTDDFRVGAHRQLASFGLLLGVPVRQARCRAELVEHLAEFGNRRLVIVDTAGMGQRDLRLIEESRKLAGVADLQSYLVISANVQREVMDEVMKAFDRERLAGCILTKLDEAARLGPALSAVLTHQLPVAFVSEGQRVPEDLRPGRASDLVSRALASSARIMQTPKASLSAGLSREVRHESA